MSEDVEKVDDGGEDGGVVFPMWVARQTVEVALTVSSHIRGVLGDEIIDPLSVTKAMFDMLTSFNEEKQCAACLSIHTGMSRFIWAFDEDTDHVIVWAPCPDCVERYDTVGDEAYNDIAMTTLRAWTSGAIEPQGKCVVACPLRSTCTHTNGQEDDE